MSRLLDFLIYPNPTLATLSTYYLDTYLLFYVIHLVDIIFDTCHDIWNKTKKGFQSHEDKNYRFMRLLAAACRLKKIKVGLVFSIFNFFMNKNSSGKKTCSWKTIHFTLNLALTIIFHTYSFFKENRQWKRTSFESNCKLPIKKTILWTALLSLGPCKVVLCKWA